MKFFQRASFTRLAFHFLSSAKRCRSRVFIQRFISISPATGLRVKGHAMQIAVRTKFRSHGADGLAARYLALPDQLPPTLVSLQCSMIFRRRRMGHLRALVVANTSVNVMRPFSAKGENFGLCVEEPFAGRSTSEKNRTSVAEGATPAGDHERSRDETWTGFDGSRSSR